MAKVALLIGVSDYQIAGSDQGFTNLPSTKLDVEGMRRILENPELGAFDHVKAKVNPTRQEMSEAIEEFLMGDDRQKDDLVLLYFSGHGAKDRNRKLHFAAKGTRKNAKEELFVSTALSAQTVRDWLAECKATKKIMVLDCCFSGAIDPNAKGDDSLEVLETSLSAVKGSIILTSSSATEISYGDPTQMSFYTRYFVQGVESGEADRDFNGYLSIKELHSYVRAKLLNERKEMTPQNIFIKEDGFFDAPLIRVPIADPAQAYRKKVKSYVDRGFAKTGEFDRYIKLALEQDRIQINQFSKSELSLNAAETIVNSLLQPIRQRLENLKNYRQAFREHLEEETLEESRESLKVWRETVLKLTDADVASIEQDEQQRLAAQRTIENNIPPTPPIISSQSAQTLSPLVVQKSKLFQEKKVVTRENSIRAAKAACF